MKIQVGLFFGGPSVEHEVSVITALQAYYAFEDERYEIIPIYITKDSRMFVGESIGDIEAYRNIPALLDKSIQITIVREEGRTYLRQIRSRAFKKDYNQVIDVAFPCVHGTNVEDGTLQGYLQTLGLPYVGCDVFSSAIGMDKFAQKAVLREAGISVLPALCPYISEYRQDPEALMNTIEQKIGYPVIVKPNNLGSSVGIRVARDRAALESALEYAFGFAIRVLVEHAITSLKEVNCSVIGDYESADASECEEPIAQDEILSYQDKYMGNSGKNGVKGAPVKGGGAKGSEGMASLSRKIPAEISAERREEIRTLAVKTFQTLGCNGVARIDFMIDKDTDALYVNEINTIPGSLAFYLWEAVGLPYSKMLVRLIELALKRERERANITFSFDSNLLAHASLPRNKH
ncbi:MAG: D-alanine--D-alanine ligase [Lachnospiraceae bacterium]|nr:D-alanine--D-alanine ligase [Lachnospiraceae bacterium]